jgi:AcrR family transcriptional regulator
MSASAPARDRLSAAALATFAEQGYHGSSTRDICSAAGMNNASIHYHFGDKAGLYRELYRSALDGYRTAMRAARIDEHRGRDALVAYHRAVLGMHAERGFAPLARLHLREESEPTGIVDDLLPHGLDLLFEVLGGLVLRELGLTEMDPDVHRLVLSLHGSGLVYVVKRRGIAEAFPGLLEDREQLIGHLADVGLAMIEVERARRGA